MTIDKAYESAISGIRSGYNQAIYRAIYTDDYGNTHAKYTEGFQALFNKTVKDTPGELNRTTRNRANVPTDTVGG